MKAVIWIAVALFFMFAGLLAYHYTTLSKLKVFENYGMEVSASKGCQNWFVPEDKPHKRLKFIVEHLFFNWENPFDFLRFTDDSTDVIYISDTQTSDLLQLSGGESVAVDWLMNTGDEVLQIHSNGLIIWPLKNKLLESNKSAAEIIVLVGKNNSETIYINSAEKVTLMHVSKQRTPKLLACDEEEGCYFFSQEAGDNRLQNLEALTQAKQEWDYKALIENLNGACDFFMEGSHKEWAERYRIVEDACAIHIDVDLLKASYEKEVKNCKIIKDKIIPHIEQFFSSDLKEAAP